jgi:steroid delta-isomerase-like uncharacterized protein
MMQPIVKQLIDCWNRHEMSAIMQLYAADFEGIDIAQSQTYKGREGLQQMLGRYFDAFPDLHFDIEEVVIEGERAALSWTSRGTHLGKIMNIPPTGRTIKVRGMTLLKFADGQVQQAAFLWDVAGLLRDIGLLPEL